MKRPTTAILHYTAPPVIGGVEVVLQAHARAFVRAGYPVTIVAGQGNAERLPTGADLIIIPEMDSRHPEVARMSAALEQGQVPQDFDDLTRQLLDALTPVLKKFDNVIVHNVFTKHFNLPLTFALYLLLQQRVLQSCIAWCHDLSWTSPSSRSKVHPGHPWDLLRMRRPDVEYVAVSKHRQRELVELFDCPVEQIHVAYNGVDPGSLLGLSAAGQALVKRLELLESDLVLLMPVRVTQAKNIEYALRVVAALKARDCRARLILTGPPDPHDPQSMAYFQELQALRAQLGVEDEMRFVFESGPEPDQPLTISEQVLGDLFRVSDVMFMPSHREGFGMPVLEAGLLGVPVVCSNNVPAAQEIGAQDVTVFDASQTPDQTAAQILAWAEKSPQHRLRRRVRQSYTWDAIFQQSIRPLLNNHGGR
jgi:glycosyltransferase involved in cell wall biosynthesis